MKTNIRRGVFETNSSSTHSICISTEAELIIPERLTFAFGEFGWESDTLRSAEEKASYLYTGLSNNDRKSDIENIVSFLESKGIEIIRSKEKASDYSDEGNVDHSDQLEEFLNAIVSDEKRLMNFLFSPFSFILTGNDNTETDVTIDVNYAHEEYFKGN